MAVERGDSSASIGATVDDSPSTFEQSTLKGTTTTGNARLIVRDASQISVIDTNGWWASNTVEGVLDEIAQLTGLSSYIQDQIDALNVRVTTNEADIVLLEAADVTLQDNIDTEEAARIAADALKYDKTGGILTGDVQIANVSPTIRYYEAGAAVDEKYFDMFSDAGITYLRFINDAYTAADNIMEVRRTGYNVDSVTFNGAIIGNDTPTADAHLTRKDYVDGEISSQTHDASDIVSGTISPDRVHYIDIPDTRAVDDQPVDVENITGFDFKQKATLTGLSTTSFYVATLTGSQWGDASGGKAYQFAIDGKRLHVREGDCGALSWDAGWAEFWSTDNFDPTDYEPADATILKDADIDVTVASPTYVDQKAVDEAIAFAIALGG